MLLGKIKGSITSTIKHASLKAQKILIVEPLNSCWPLDSSLRWNDSKILEKNCKIARFARLKRQVLKKY